MAQHDKLASMLEGLRDSETKLEALVKTLEKYQPSEVTNMLCYCDLCAFFNILINISSSFLNSVILWCNQ